jgi:oligopeptide transport system permease protein
VLKFVVRRGAQALLVIIVVTLVVYAGLFYFGNPFASIGEKTIPPETQAVLRAKFGMDEPFFVRYLIYLRNLFTGEFGVDFDQRRPVADLLAAAAPNTIKLALVTIAVGTVLGILAGVVAAVWRDSFWDGLITTGAIVLLSIPVFVLATAMRAELAGLRVLGIELFPSLPRRFGVEVPWYREVLLPAVSLAAGDAVFVARLMRASMLDVLAADYLRTARAKGLRERTVVLKHGVRNAIIPVANHSAIALGGLISGTLIVETIFQYRGLGYLFIRSVLEANRPVLMAIAAVGTITFVVLVALVDMLCAYLDPRIRLN